MGELRKVLSTGALRMGAGFAALLKVLISDLLPRPVPCRPSHCRPHRCYALYAEAELAYLNCMHLTAVACLSGCFISAAHLKTLALLLPSIRRLITQEDLV